MTQIQPLAFPLMPTLAPPLVEAEAQHESSGFLELMPMEPEELAADPSDVLEGLVPPAPTIPAPVALWQVRGEFDDSARTVMESAQVAPVPDPVAGTSIPIVAGESQMPDMTLPQGIAPPEDLPPESPMRDEAIPPSNPGGTAADRQATPPLPVAEVTTEGQFLPRKQDPSAQGVPPPMIKAEAPEAPALAPRPRDEPVLVPLPGGEAMTLPVTPLDIGPAEPKPVLLPVMEPSARPSVADTGQPGGSGSADTAPAVPEVSPTDAKKAPPSQGETVPFAQQGPGTAKAGLPGAPFEPAAEPVELHLPVVGGQRPDQSPAPLLSAALLSRWPASRAAPEAVPERLDAPSPAPLEISATSRAGLPDRPILPDLEEPAPPIPTVAAIIAMPQEERAGRALWPSATLAQTDSKSPLQPSVPQDRPISAMPETESAVPEIAALRRLPVDGEPSRKVSGPTERSAGIGKADPAQPAIQQALPSAGQVAPVGQQPQVAPPERSSAAMLADPAPVRVQILQALTASGGPMTELRLAPEELGHVRIDMRHEGDRLVMTVSAERQDTLELLRRHAGELVADLRAGGHTGLDLSFGRWAGSGPESGRQPTELAEAPLVPLAETLPAVAPDTRPFQPASGLYLRI